MRQLLAAFLAGALTGPAGMNGAEDVSQANVASSSDGGHDAATDAGQVAIFAQCQEPDAGDVAQELDGGYFVLSPARASYDSCRIGAGKKCSALLEQLPDAGTPDATRSNLWLVTSAICALSTLTSAYIQNRTARHLPILP